MNSETWYAELDIESDGSSHTRQKQWVDGYLSGFGLPIVSGSCFWAGLEPNRPIFPVQTRTAGGLPGPVANAICKQSLVVDRFHKGTQSCYNSSENPAFEDMGKLPVTYMSYFGAISFQDSLSLNSLDGNWITQSISSVGF